MKEVEGELLRQNEDRQKIKKPYETPTLTRLGTIAEITNGLNPGVKDGGALGSASAP